jgi:hypothetical protein
MRIKESMMKSVSWLALLLFICSCNASRPFYQSGEKQALRTEDKQIDYSLFLIGDTGTPQLENAKEVLQTLRYQLQQAGDSSSVLFLGDNLYPNGMPPHDDPGRKEAEARIVPALNSLRGYSGRSFFIPGNHDWENGIEGMKAQEDFIEQYPDITSQFVPENGCPGPASFSLSKQWQLIVLDSEWWINRSFNSNPQVDGCKQQSRSDVMRQTEDLIDEYDDKNILVTFHHPLYSNGTHGSYHPLKDHIFPLTNFSKYGYLPLPLVGSLYPIARQIGKFPQDLINNNYQEFKRELLQATEDKEHVFFAAGHEHSLSFYEKDKANTAKEGQDFFILSGAGSKKSYARKAYGAEFVYSRKGFAKLVSYTDGSVAVEFWVPENGSKKGRLAYRKQLLEPNMMISDNAKNQDQPQSTKAQPDSMDIAAGHGYAAGGFKRLIWGNHYRDAWTQEVQAPVLNLDTEKGGLNILEKTGGVQTVTIIAEDSGGRRYVMRSVQKDPTKSLPEALQKTFAADIAKDQTSATHPYGGEVAASLASAAGVYHTTPELRYIPGESAFDLNTGNSSGTLVTVEEFVSTEWFNRSYGKSASEVIDTDELWERLRRDSADTIDEGQLVRSRLFDMYIGDWDRHEKQWFWAETPTDTGAVYEPIPIDRDNAFYRSDGLMLGLARRFVLPKFQNFGDDIDNIKGLNLNAQHFDRWFINELSREEWMDIARQMQQSITDSAITAAVGKWPEAIRQLDGPSFIKKLKARRDRLPDFAGRYYDLLMRQVNVYGSSDAEEFIVEPKADGSTNVLMYRHGRSGEQKLRYHRVFRPGETGEIRLYGFGGNDRFTVKDNGKENKNGKAGANGDILFRIIGGGGKDTIENQAARFAENILVYDTKNGSTINSSTIEGGTNINDKRSADPRVNRYEKRGFQYNFTGPLLTSGYNSTDGVFIGGGTVIRNQAFRKHPFSARHRITGKVATRTAAFSLGYDGLLTEEIGDFHLELAAEVVSPNRSVNYFGSGNGTEKTRGSDFYNYRMDKANLYAGLSETLAELLTIRAGIGAEYYNPSEEYDQFITSSAADLDEEAFGAHYYTTLNGGFSVDATDRSLNPRYGTKFNFLSELKIGLNDKSSSFNRIGADLSFYYTFQDITTTLATRGGFATNIGYYSFFQANSLGGQSFSGRSENLRGFLRNRFAGRTSVFHNTELRTKLFDVKSYFIPGTMGVLAFLDEGRVWSEEGDSSRWHFGYGGSLWFSPFDSFVLTGGLAFSTEETLLIVSLGFPF